MHPNANDVVVTLRLPSEFADEIKKAARAHERSASAELRVAAWRHVEATTREASGNRAA
jgi:hypothetical protein